MIFIAAITDNRFRAIALATGKTLFEDELPTGGQATPVTYEANGRQYVGIMAGGHRFVETPIGDELVAYCRFFAGYVATPGFRECWRDMRETVSAEFADWVDGRCAMTNRLPD